MKAVDSAKNLAGGCNDPVLWREGQRRTTFNVVGLAEAGANCRDNPCADGGVHGGVIRPRGPMIK